MKKLGLIIVLAVVAAFGITGAPASAASCSTQMSSIAWTGQLSFDAILWNCDTVDKVQFKSYAGNAIPGYTGIWDATASYFHDIPQTCAWYVSGDNCNGEIAMHGRSYIYESFSTPAWCNGASHTVSTYFTYRIHNPAGVGSWGPYHTVGGTNYYNINC